MNLRIAIRSVQALLAGLLCLLVSACASSGSFKVGWNGKYVEYEFNGEDPHKTMDVEGSPEMQGATLCLTFKDADGNPTGTVQVTVPATNVPVPAGSEEFEGEVCEEDDDSDDSQGLAGSGTVRRTTPQPQGPRKARRVGSFLFLGGPVDPDPTDGVLTYTIEIADTSRTRARSTLESILQVAEAGPLGFGRPVPGIYTIHVLAHTQLIGTEMVFLHADESVFQRLDFGLNGVERHRTLADAVLSSNNGWHLAVLSVPIADFEYGVVPGATYRNDYSFDCKTRDGQDSYARGRWDYTFE